MLQVVQGSRSVGNGSKPLRDAWRQSWDHATVEAAARCARQLCTLGSMYLCGLRGGQLSARRERGAEALLWPEPVEWDAESDFTAWSGRDGDARKVRCGK